MDCLVWGWVWDYVCVDVFVVVFFFFKQKTAYEMLRSLVGSEMCIRDSREGPPELDVRSAKLPTRSRIG